MNVLILTAEFIPVWGGAGTYIVELAKNMPSDIQIFVVTPYRSAFGSNHAKINREIEESFPENVHINYLGKANDTFLYNFNFQLNCLKNIKRLLKNYKIDIIHSQSAMPDLFISARNVGVPIVTTVHTTIEGQYNAIKHSNINFFKRDFSEKMVQTLNPVLKYMENFYYSSSRQYITVSKWSKNEFIKEKNIERDKVKVIYNGVNTNRFKKYNRNEAIKCFPQLEDNDVPIVSYISRLIGSKGLHLLINSIPEILSKVDAHFVFAGPGQKPDIDIPNINHTFLGYIPNEMVQYLYSLTDIFVLPSLYENFPISILEAMASQCAVISTNVGGIPELITHLKDGYLIRPNNQKDVVNSIIAVIENEELNKKLRINARKTVAERFNWKDIAKSTLEYYEEIICNYS